LWVSDFVDKNQEAKYVFMFMDKTDTKRAHTVAKTKSSRNKYVGLFEKSSEYATIFELLSIKKSELINTEGFKMNNEADKLLDEINNEEIDIISSYKSADIEMLKRLERINKRYFRGKKYIDSDSCKQLIRDIDSQSKNDTHGFIF
jgi:hypothetical protein